MQHLHPVTHRIFIYRGTKEKTHYQHSLPFSIRFTLLPYYPLPFLILFQEKKKKRISLHSLSSRTLKSKKDINFRKFILPFKLKIFFFLSLGIIGLLPFRNSSIIDGEKTKSSISNSYSAWMSSGTAIEYIKSGLVWIASWFSLPFPFILYHKVTRFDIPFLWRSEVRESIPSSTGYRYIQDNLIISRTSSSSSSSSENFTPNS